MGEFKKYLILLLSLIILASFSFGCGSGTGSSSSSSSSLASISETSSGSSLDEAKSSSNSVINSSSNVSGGSNSSNSSSETIIEWPTTYTEGLEYALNADGESYSVTGIGTATDTTVVIPNEYNNKPVTEIGENAFHMDPSGEKPLANIINVYIPKSIIIIGGAAFWSNDNLQNVYFEDGSQLKNIGPTAFSMTRITKIKIPNGVTSIDDDIFSWTPLEQIEIPNTVLNIGWHAFGMCTNLSKVIFEENSQLETIEYNAFSGCESLTSIDLPESLTNIGDGAFYGCFNLKSINLPESLTNIEGGTFYGCESLTSIDLPNSLTSIGDIAFYGCFNLTSIELPENLTDIGNEAFLECYKLVEIYNNSSLLIVAGREDYGYVAYYALNVCLMPSQALLSVDNNGYVIFNFRNEKILINYIGSETNLTIPESITQIYQYCFYNNKKITDITFENLSGWYITKDFSATSGTNISSEDLENTTTAATYLTSTYYRYYWKRTA